MTVKTNCYKNLELKERLIFKKTSQISVNPEESTLINQLQLASMTQRVRMNGIVFFSILTSTNFHKTIKIQYWLIGLSILAYLITIISLDYKKNSHQIIGTRQNLYD